MVTAFTVILPRVEVISRKFEISHFHPFWYNLLSTTFGKAAISPLFLPLFNVSSSPEFIRLSRDHHGALVVTLFFLKKATYCAKNSALVDVALSRFNLVFT